MYAALGVKAGGDAPVVIGVRYEQPVARQVGRQLARIAQGAGQGHAALFPFQRGWHRGVAQLPALPIVLKSRRQHVVHRLLLTLPCPANQPCSDLGMCRLILPVIDTCFSPVYRCSGPYTGNMKETNDYPQADLGA